MQINAAPYIVALLISFTAQANEVLRLEAVRLSNISQDYRWGGDSSNTVADSQLEFIVSSSGCTKSEDFELQIDRAGNTQHVRVIRKVPDHCRALPHPETIVLTTKKLKASIAYPIVIKNPILIDAENSPPGQLNVIQ